MALVCRSGKTCSTLWWSISVIAFRVRLRLRSSGSVEVDQHDLTNAVAASCSATIDAGPKMPTMQTVTRPSQGAHFPCKRNQSVVRQLRRCLTGP